MQMGLRSLLNLLIPRIMMTFLNESNNDDSSQVVLMLGKKLGLRN